MTKYHINPKTLEAGQCSAKPGNCPFGNDEEHFSTLAEAVSASEKLLLDMYQWSSKRGKYPLSAQEQLIREKNYNLASSLVEQRSAEQAITYEDANPLRAQRRLREAVEYARARGNIHLADKLSSARVLPSGAFKTADGVRVSTDSVLKTQATLKAIGEARELMIAELLERCPDDLAVGTKFTHKDASGSYTLTVVEAIDDYAYDALTPTLKAKASIVKEQIDIDKARKELSPEQFKAITNESQVIDYVLGKTSPAVLPKAELSSSDSVQKGLEDIASFYRDTRETVGTVRSLKAKLAEGSNAIKSVAASHEGNTFAPARSQYNGALVTSRRTVDEKKAKNLLSSALVKKITKSTFYPDREKAAKELDTKTFDKIFGARMLSLRVVETKE